MEEAMCKISRTRPESGTSHLCLYFTSTELVLWPLLQESPGNADPGGQPYYVTPGEEE